MVRLYIENKHASHNHELKVWETVNRFRKFTRVLDNFKISSFAFGQLTRKYMQEEFNPTVPDIEGVR
jgi:hypothetical protein